jgi:sporulation protein YlmC with PRC-barrel domain
MTEEQAVYEVKPTKMGRPKKKVKGERLWIPAEYVQAVKAYLEIARKNAEKEECEQ